METMTLSDCMKLFKTFRKRQEGQTMAEYAVVLGVITLAVVGVFTALAGGINNAISSVTGVI
jgi:Flp pilus assembly pilin Flp